MHQIIKGSLFVVGLVSPLISSAQDVEVKITEDISYSTVKDNGKLVRVSRIQDTAHVISGSFSKTSRPCPPFCINPIILEEGVETFGELEVIRFMETELYRGDGVLIDARTPSWYKKGTIPGSINIPFTVFSKGAKDSQLAKVLESLGAKKRADSNFLVDMLESIGLFGGGQKTDIWNFSKAKDLLLWCNGPWCGQSPRAIRGLMAIGYPAEKLHYYRGGLQMWQSLGLTTINPKDGKVDQAGKHI